MERAPVEDLESVISREDFLGWQSMVTRVFMGEQVKAYLVAIANHLRADSRCLSPPSPRAVLMLARVSQAHALTQSRDFVSPDDVIAVAADVLAHRMVLSGDRSGRTFIEEALAQVNVPA